METMNTDPTVERLIKKSIESLDKQISMLQIELEGLKDQLAIPSVIWQSEQLPQSVLLTEKVLVDLDFEVVRFKEPNYNVGIDRFWGLDYAIMRINQKTGNGDDLIIRFREGKFILDGFYSVRFYNKQDVLDLISCFTKATKTTV